MPTISYKKVLLFVVLMGGSLATMEPMFEEFDDAYPVDNIPFFDDDFFHSNSLFGDEEDLLNDEDTFEPPFFDSDYNNPQDEAFFPMDTHDHDVYQAPPPSSFTFPPTLPSPPPQPNASPQDKPSPSPPPQPVRKKRKRRPSRQSSKTPPRKKRKKKSPCQSPIEEIPVNKIKKLLEVCKPYQMWKRFYKCPNCRERFTLPSFLEHFNITIQHCLYFETNDLKKILRKRICKQFLKERESKLQNYSLEKERERYAPKKHFCTCGREFWKENFLHIHMFLEKHGNWQKSSDKLSKNTTRYF